MNNNIVGNKKLCTFLIMAIISCLLAMPVLAGEGDGSGGGQGVPLGLASSTPADGQTGVSLQPEIKLTFNKNVINIAIRDANKNCFSLLSAAGSMVPIEVIMADDQIYPEEKRNVTLKSLQQLLPGKTYTVKISPQLQAKNGTSLGHEVTFSFTTKAAPMPEEPPVPKDSTDKPKTEAVAPENSNTPIENKAAPTVEEQKKPTQASQPAVEKKSSSRTSAKKTVSQPQTGKYNAKYMSYLLAGGLGILAVLGLYYFKKRKMK